MLGFNETFIGHDQDGTGRNFTVATAKSLASSHQIRPISVRSSNYDRRPSFPRTRCGVEATPAGAIAAVAGRSSSIHSLGMPESMPGLFSLEALTPAEEHACLVSYNAGLLRASRRYTNHGVVSPPSLQGIQSMAPIAVLHLHCQRSCNTPTFVTKFKYC
jgi:hypothetical protein